MGGLVLDTLPFTGLNEYLVLPGMALVFAGLVALLVSGPLGLGRRKGRRERSPVSEG
jgi:hypothetical protein